MHYAVASKILQLVIACRAASVRPRHKTKLVTIPHARKRRNVRRFYAGRSKQPVPIMQLLRERRETVTSVNANSIRFSPESSMPDPWA